MASIRSILLILSAAALLTGCQSGRALLTKANPLNWGSGRAAQNEEKAEKKADSLENQLVQKAQVEVVKTGAAIAAAKVEHPDSRPIEVAERTNANAAALLNQREPLDVATAQAALETIKGLLSSETAAREKAEAAQARAEASSREIGTALESTRRALAALKAKADAEAAKNLEMANELNNLRLQRYGLAGLSAAVGILTIMYRLNIGRLQTGAGELLARLQAKHGDEVAVTARGALDAVLHTGEQKGVYKAFSAITARRE